MQEISVASATDLFFIKHIPSLLNSISQNTKSKVLFYLFVNDIPKVHLDRLHVICRQIPRISLIVIDATDHLKDTKVDLLRHITRATMHRLHVTSLLPQTGKLIYLDVDLVVNADIRILYSMPVSEKGICAKSSIKPGHRSIKELMRSWVKTYDWKIAFSELGLEDFSCFNAGVLLLDLNKLRQNGFEGYVIPIVQKYGFNDQLALNVYAQGDYKKLPPSWNVFVNQDDPEEKNIIHWAGSRKPWLSSDASLKCYWDKYFISWEKGRFISIIKSFFSPFMIFLRKAYSNMRALLTGSRG